MSCCNLIVRNWIAPKIIYAEFELRMEIVIEIGIRYTKSVRVIYDANITTHEGD